jgi:hypothetical protein
MVAANARLRVQQNVRKIRSEVPGKSRGKFAVKLPRRKKQFCRGIVAVS